MMTIRHASNSNFIGGGMSGGRLSGFVQENTGKEVFDGSTCTSVSVFLEVKA